MFNLIQYEKDTDSLNQSLIIDLEKYFELNHYTLGDIANRNDLSLEYINNFLIKYSIPLDNNKKAGERIHDLMFDKHIAPRELYLFNKFSKDVKLRGEFPGKRDILNLFYPDDTERRNEIFSVAFEFISYFYESMDKLSSNNKKLDIISILFNLGINPEEENELIIEDENFIEFKKMGLEYYYYLAFDLAGWILIYRDLTGIFKYFFSTSLEILKVVLTKIDKFLKNISINVSVSVQAESKPVQEKIQSYIPIMAKIDQITYDNAVVYATM